MRSWRRSSLSVYFLILVFIVPKASAQTPFVVAHSETTAALIPLVKEVYSRIGISAKFVLVPSERAIKGANSGHYDADMSRVAGSLVNYPNLLFTEESLFEAELYAYAKQSAHLSISKAGDLTSHTVGLVRGSKLAELFVAELGLVPQVANSAASFYAMLDKGRFEIALITSTQLLTQPQSIPSNVVRVGPVIERRKAFHVINKMHKDLIPKFDEALKAVKSDVRFTRGVSKNSSVKFNDQNNPTNKSRADF